MSHQAQVSKAAAVSPESRAHPNTRPIEASLKAVYGLGKWLLATVRSVLVVAVVGFILKGGPLG